MISKLPGFSWSIARRASLLFVFTMATVLTMTGLLTTLGTHINLADYSVGTAPEPYQSRVLMIPVERLAYHSTLIEGAASHAKGSFRDPGLWAIFLSGMLSLALSGMVAVAIYRSVSTSKLGVWLIYPLLLVEVVYTFEFRQGVNVIYPYDLPGMFFITLGVYLAYKGHFWLLLALMPVATLNRETSFLLVPIAAAMMAARGSWRTDKVANFLQLLILTATWLVVLHWEKTHYPGIGADNVDQVRRNLHAFVSPKLWGELMGAGAFLWVVPIYGWNLLRDRRLRFLLLIIPVWMVALFLRAAMVESRVFTECLPMLAVYTVAILESAFKAEPAVQTPVQIA